MKRKQGAKNADIIRRIRGDAGVDFLLPLTMYLTTDISLRQIAEQYNISLGTIESVSKRQGWYKLKESVRRDRLCAEVAALQAQGKERIASIRDLDVHRLQAATDKLQRVYESLVMPDSPEYEATPTSRRWTMDKAKTYAEAYSKILTSKYRAAGIADAAPANVDIQLIAPQGMLAAFRVRQPGQIAEATVSEAIEATDAELVGEETPPPMRQITPPSHGHTLTSSASGAVEKDHFGSFLEAFSGA